MSKLAKEMLDIFKAAVIIGSLVFAMATSLWFALGLTGLLLVQSIQQAKDDRWGDHEL